MPYKNSRCFMLKKPVRSLNRDRLSLNWFCVPKEQLAYLHVRSAPYDGLILPASVESTFS